MEAVFEYKYAWQARENVILRACGVPNFQNIITLLERLQLMELPRYSSNKLVAGSGVRNS